jgi:hypothetical protein
MLSSSLMSIHFYKKGDTRHSLFELSDEAYNMLENSFNTLETKTGIFIDPHGTAALYPDNIKLLCSLIRQQFPVGPPGKQAALVERILQQLQQLYELNELIQAVGD